MHGLVPWNGEVKKMEILTILKANIRYKKGAFSSVIILMFIITAAITAIISSNDLTYSSLNQALEDIGTGDLIVWIDSGLAENVYDGLESNKNVESFHVDDCMFTNYNIINGHEVKNNESYGMLKWNNNYKVFNDNLNDFIANPEPLKSGEVYVPITFQNIYDCKIGSEIIIQTNFGDEVMYIKGFVQEPLAGAQFIGIKHFFISDEDFHKMSEKKIDTKEKTSKLLEDYKTIHIVKAVDSTLSMPEFKKSLNETSGIIDYSLFTESKNTMKGYTAIFNEVGSGILYAFIIILFVIVIVIICHSISSGIEMDYTNLGILKANGFTNKKIRMIYILQYMIAQLLGIMLGIAASYPIIMILGKLYLPITGIFISGGISVLKILGLLLSMITIVCLFVVVLTSKIGKISPVRAISGGVKQIYFDSHMKTQIHKKALSLTLAFRQFTSNKKQYLGTLIISAGLVFFMMSMSLLANCMSSERFMESFGEIASDLEIAFTEDYVLTEFDHVIEDIEKIGKVEEYSAMNYEYVTLNGVNIWCGFYKNLSGLEKRILKGRTPLYDNEFVITEIIAEEYGLSIGDEVVLSTKDGKSTYMISGLYQSTNDMGMCIAMGYDAYKKIGTLTPDYLHIKLTDSSLSKEISDTLNERYSGKLESSLPDDDFSITDMIETALNGITTLIYIISIIFTLVTVKMVCTRSFLRERTDIGIYKALGFTIRQLRLQFSFRFFIVSMIGAAVGIIFCIFLCPTMMEALLRRIGVTNFITDYTPDVIILPVCMICLCFFLFAYMVSGKIKKVDARELISE